MNDNEVIIVIRLGVYLKFMGPFATCKEADQWAQENLADGYDIVEIYGTQGKATGPPRSVKQRSGELAAPSAYRWTLGRTVDDVRPRPRIHSAGPPHRP